jgi:hypothetical protein
MQDRRYRPGDVLDDYCPRERRITDHAVVAMIDDAIQRTRCGSCDAEHEYKEAKVPAPRRKTQPPGLFNQVLDNINGAAPRAVAPSDATPVPVDAVEPLAPVEAAGSVEAVESMAVEPPREHVVAASARDSEPAETDQPVEPAEPAEDGGFRRSLIRATFPRPDGQASTPRANPEFTIQSLNNRGRNNGGQRHAGGQNKFRGRRRQGGGNQDHIGPMRFRDHGQQSGDGRSQGQGQGGGRRRRGGKKNR